MTSLPAGAQAPHPPTPGGEEGHQDFSARGSWALQLPVGGARSRHRTLVSPTLGRAIRSQEGLHLHPRGSLRGGPARPPVAGVGPCLSACLGTVGSGRFRHQGRWPGSFGRPVAACAPPSSGYLTAGASLWGQGTHLGPQGIACKGGRKAVTKWAAAAEVAPGVQRAVAMPSPSHPGPADPVLGGEVHPGELGEGLQAFQPWLGLADVYRKCPHCLWGGPTAWHTQDTHMTPTGAPPHTHSALDLHAHATHMQCILHAHLCHTHTHTARWTCTLMQWIPAPACYTLQYMHACTCTHTCSLRSGPCGPLAVLPASPTLSLACAGTTWGSALLGVGAAAEPALHWGPDIGAQ